MSEMGSRTHQGGQSIIIVAVALVALVLFVAITVDMSEAYHQRRVAQNAADSAALAGAQELGRTINGKSANDSWIKTLMNDFAERNGIEDTNGSPADAENANVEGFYLDRNRNVVGTIGAGSVPAGAVGVRAVAHTTATTYFGGIFGLAGLPLQARAAVVYDMACSGGPCMLPIAMKDTGFLDGSFNAVGQCFNVWDGEGAGNFGWLNWSFQDYSCKDQELWYSPYITDTLNELGYTSPEDLPDDCSADCIVINMDPDFCSRVEPGTFVVGETWVGGAPGVNNADRIRDSLIYYMKSGEPVSVFVYDESTGTGCGKPGNDGHQYLLAGFACFELTGFRLSSGGGAVMCDLVAGAFDEFGDPVVSCGDCKLKDGVLNCPTLPSGLSCDPTGAADYPGTCEEVMGIEDCSWETGDYNRITGRFVSCTGGDTGECSAVGNMLAPYLDE